MNDFSLPTNIRQIGGVDDRLRIYVEDYAISYLKRFAEFGGDSDRLAFLVGKYMVIDNKGYLFICGAIQGKFSTRDDGAEVFSDESFDYATECLEKYFDGYEIVGWMQSQPGYGTGLNPVCGDYHMNNFIKPYHALLVIDPAEKLESFYLWENNMSAMIEAKGYFIFYERNRGMQEYILENRLTGVRGFSRGRSTDGDGEKPTGRADREPRPRGTGHGEASVASSKRGTGNSEYRKIVNMLVSLSAVLFVICFIMGAGLIQSDNKIVQLEKDMSALNGAFSYVISQVNQMATQPAFAAGDNPMTPAATSTFEVPEPRQVTVISTEQEPVMLSAADSTPEPTPAPTPEPTPEPTTEPTQPPSQSLSISADPPTETPEPAVEPGPDQGVSLPQATLPPAQISVNIPTPNPTPSPNRGLTYEAAMEALVDMDGYDTYTVQRGDTLSGICYRYYGSTDMIEKVMQVNGITHPDMIFFGRVLIMPRIENADAESEEP